MQTTEMEALDTVRSEPSDPLNPQTAKSPNTPVRFSEGAEQVKGRGLERSS